MGKRVGIVIFAVVLLVALSEVSVYRSRLRPCVLILHLPPGTWKTITVQSENLRVPVTFTPTDAPVQIDSIRHGPYVVRVELVGGKVVWATFFQADVGVRRQVEIDVTPEPDSTVGFREVVNGREQVFAGRVRPAQTSADRPLRLEWI